MPRILAGKRGRSRNVKAICDCFETDWREACITSDLLQSKNIDSLVHPHFQYVICDLMGRIVTHGEIDGSEIDLGPIGPGAYLLKIEGWNQVVKFVKE